MFLFGKNFPGSEQDKTKRVKDVDFFGNTDPEQDALVLADRKVNPEKYTRVRKPVQDPDMVKIFSEVNDPVPFFDMKHGRQMEVTGVVRVFFEKGASFDEAVVNECVKQGFISFFTSVSAPELGCEDIHTRNDELTGMIMEELKGRGINAHHVSSKTIRFGDPK